jgi:hypothetical protein
MRSIESIKNKRLSLKQNISQSFQNLSHSIGNYEKI